MIPEALGGAPVAVISQGLATRDWSGRDPVERSLQLSTANEPRRIIGVVGDAWLVISVSRRRPVVVGRAAPGLASATVVAGLC